MPSPLNSRSGFKDPSALVVLRGDDFNRLFAVWQMVTLGRLQVKYTANITPGFAIPEDLSNPITLVLPPPTLGTSGNVDSAKLDLITLDVCLPGGGTKSVKFVTSA